jgi:hypothetical protein
MSNPPDISETDIEPFDHDASHWQAETVPAFAMIKHRLQQVSTQCLINALQILPRSC